MLSAGVCTAQPVPNSAGTTTSPDARRFDGAWTTIVDCATTPDGALGYTLQFVSQVKDGRLFGEHGREGQPGRIKLEGDIDPSGTALLSARGLTSDPKFSVNHVRTLSPYSYHVKARF